MKKLILMVLLMLMTSITFAIQKQEPKVLTIDTIDAVTDTVETSSTTDCSKSESPDTAISIASELTSGMSNNLVPFSGIVAVFGSPIVIILIILIFQYKKRKAQYELIAKALEAGKDIPAGLFQQENTEVKNNLSKGMLNLFAGLGISILFWVLVNIKLASIGAFISCIGIGQIITYFIMKKSSKRQVNKESEEEKTFTSESK